MTTLSGRAAMRLIPGRDTGLRGFYAVAAFAVAGILEETEGK